MPRPPVDRGHTARPSAAIGVTAASHRRPSAVARATAAALGPSDSDPGPAASRPRPSARIRATAAAPRQSASRPRASAVTRATRATALAPVLAALTLLVAACAPGPAASAPNPPSTAATAAPPAATAQQDTAQQELTGELRIFAAASLRPAFDELATAFEARHPSLDVRPITYDGSSTLATQLREGAPADVFASADERTMGTLVDAGLAEDPTLFATNTLVLVVPAGNPGHVDEPEDLADPNLTVVLCAPEVPCGAASQQLLTNAGIEASVDSYEQNVTAVLTKVATGEADAGLVYVTDAATTRDVETIEVPGADRVVNRYPITVLDDANNAAAAEEFVAFVRGPEGQRTLAAHGFGKAP